MRLLWRSNVKSMRSNDDRFRWNEANPPTTNATVRIPMTAFRRTDLRMAAGARLFNRGALGKSTLSTCLQTFARTARDRVQLDSLRKIGFSDRKSARLAKKAYIAIFLAPLAAAEVEDPQTAQREVVADGIGDVEDRELVGNRARRFPVGGLPIVESEER